jgi:hypothetical protein
MKRGFSYAAWLDARKRLLRARATEADRIHGRTDERAARAALAPRTGDVTPSPIHPPIHRG